MILRFVAASLALALPAGFAMGGEQPPLALHPDNPRYFLFRGEPTVLVTSGEHYGAVLNRDFDYVRYLDALADDVRGRSRPGHRCGRADGLQFGGGVLTTAAGDDRHEDGGQDDRQGTFPARR